MRFRIILLAVAAAIMLAACSKPMENKELGNKDRDNTSKAMKQAGGADE